MSGAISQVCLRASPTWSNRGLLEASPCDRVHIRLFAVSLAVLLHSRPNLDSNSPHAYVHVHVGQLYTAHASHAYHLYIKLTTHGITSPNIIPKQRDNNTKIALT